MEIADGEINDFRRVTKERYGFVSDLALPLWQNVESQLRTVDLNELAARPRNATCHNLLRSSPLPVGAPQLLGLGLNFCVKPSSTKEMTKDTFVRLERDIRRMYHLRDADKNGSYNPKLYLKSDYVF